MQITKNKICCIALVVLTLCSYGPANALADNKKNNKNRNQEIEISGLILDNTISRQGHNFASQLARFLQEIPNTFGKNVVVKETIVPQAGTQVDVIFDNKVVYRTYFGRRLMPLEPRVAQAVNLLLDAVARSDIQANNPDLAEDEW